MASADKKEKRAVCAKSPSCAGRRQGEERLSGEQVCEGAVCVTKNMGFMWQLVRGQHKLLREETTLERVL